MASAIERYRFADYLNVADSEGPEEYELMGVGFTTLDENPGAQSESKIYISDRTASSSIKSYETQFSYESEIIQSEKAIMALYKTGRNHLTGSNAEFDYIRVELWDPVPEQTTQFKARKFRVANEVSSFAGAGGEAVVVSGNLNAVGDPVEGTFDTSTKTFTEGDPS